MASNGSFLESHLSLSAEAFQGLPAPERGERVRAWAADLHAFFDEGRAVEARALPEPTRRQAIALRAAVRDALPEDDPARGSLDARVVTDEALRGEYDRDQNVYLGAFFTRRLTRARPDVVFQPLDAREVAAAIRWSRTAGVPLTVRGAGSAAMGGAVPADGGVVLDLSRLDEIRYDENPRTVAIGAGTRFRPLHEALAKRGRALPVYTSNLGGTYAGWLATGGIGLNAYGSGRALDAVRWLEAVLATGEAYRIHRDGRLELPEADGGWRALGKSEAGGWLDERGLAGHGLSEWAGSEGQLGVIVRLGLGTRPRPEMAGFLLGFESEAQAFAFVAWVREWAPSAFPLPANLKLLTASHLEEARAAWADDDARAFRRRSGALSSGAGMPWGGLAGPRECLLPADLLSPADGESPDGEKSPADEFEAYVFLDFAGREAGVTFARTLRRAPGRPRVLERESLRFSAERFRPQSVKRFGPGLLAAEILLPAGEVPAFLPAARLRARGAGVNLDAEVYYLADGTALVLAGYLTDTRRARFGVQLLLAPVLTDLALRRHRGRPYVFGRWQGAFFARAHGRAHARRLRRRKRTLDPRWLLSRGSTHAMGLRGPLGRLAEFGFPSLVRVTGGLFGSTLALPFLALARGLLSLAPGPARGRGVPAPEAPPDESGRFEPEDARRRAVHCVNCGECNSVCPIFHDSGVRLPQMLTHRGEALEAGETPGHADSVLLDLCMRCGNCEEVCQAGIPHLALYEGMQEAADAAAGRDRERHLAILAAVRTSERYLREFLDVRPGGYRKRVPAALPGLMRFVLQRTENDAGAAATCIHCAACVPVCPTGANLEFQEPDARLITTDQARCIGCGTCVEVCPANHANGGQTLRVMEAPTLEWLRVAGAAPEPPVSEGGR